MKEIFKPPLNLGSWICLLAFVITACSPAAPPPLPTVIPSTTNTHQTASREAQVQSVEIELLEANPIQVNAIVRGNLTESCATLDEHRTEYQTNTFTISLFVVSRSDLDCAQATSPFETTITLETNNLPAGTYTVIANGVSAVFSLPTSGTTPVPGSTPTAIPNVVPTSQACTDSAAFVTDVTIPDNQVIAPNTPFTKTWRLKNTGSCTWDTRYLVSYISGTTMSQQPGYWIVQQGQTVAPGQTVDISVGMTSPIGNGNYASYWGLKKESGQLMPIRRGANGNSFYVKIKVDDGSVSAGNITAASIEIEREEGSAAACSADATYFVHAYITADGPTTATYEINSTAGQIAAGNFQTSPTGPVSPVMTGTVVFDQASTRTINLRFVGPYPYPSDITVNLRVVGGEWHSTKLACQ